jgi:hypothetical protein
LAAAWAARWRSSVTWPRRRSIHSPRLSMTLARYDVEVEGDLARVLPEIDDG